MLRPQRNGIAQALMESPSVVVTFNPPEHGAQMLPSVQNQIVSSSWKKVLLPSHMRPKRILERRPLGKNWQFLAANILALMRIKKAKDRLEQVIMSVDSNAQVFERQDRVSCCVHVVLVASWQKTYARWRRSNPNFFAIYLRNSMGKAGTSTNRLTRKCLRLARIASSRNRCLATKHKARVHLERMSFFIVQRLSWIEIF
jgi:hypothetical protein